MHLCVTLDDGDAERLAQILDGLLEANRAVLRELRASEMYVECDEIKREVRMLLKLRDRMQQWQDVRKARGL